MLSAALTVLDSEGARVIRDADIAVLYGVQTKALLQDVKRDPSRIPPDFMFQLTLTEARASRAQIVTLNEGIRSGRGFNIKCLPYAFTEQGVAMLSSVPRSERGIQHSSRNNPYMFGSEAMISAHTAQSASYELFFDGYQVNIEIMRTLVRLRQLLATNQELARRLDVLERKSDKRLGVVFGAIRKLMTPPTKPPKKIGFRHE
ncbi:MAG: ORF6N domain-containing protein [Candidatus Riflebacteria bacterium]|nr:ORF6N domain-containing protein [Candidatus Riflebacteria bacterium]